MSFLDLDEALLDVFKAVELTVSPITDFTDYAFPDLTVGIIEGGVGNVEQEEIVHKLRKHCKVLIAWGDCAVFGGVNTMRNWIPKEEVLRYGYIQAASTVDGVLPIHEELPPLLDKVLPVNEVAPVDVYVPGCPPAPEGIAYALQEILQGRIPVLPTAMMHFD
jgi:NAD-reducing hydrogenase small subunit